MAKLCQCSICYVFYNGFVDGDCGSQDETHRKARGQATDNDED